MKYVSMDLETTGLDPMTCQILKVGAILADIDGTIYARLHLYVVNKRVFGEPYALKMNEQILDKIEEVRKRPFVSWDKKDPKNFNGYTSNQPCASRSKNTSGRTSERHEDDALLYFLAMRW